MRIAPSRPAPHAAAPAAAPTGHRHTPAAPAPGRPRSAVRSALVTVGGDDVHEDLFSAAFTLQAALTDEGFATRTSVGTASLSDAADLDVIVLFTALGRFTPEQRRALEAAVRAGCGLLALHSTAVLASPPEQADQADELLAALIGSRYVSHGPPPHESRFEVLLDRDHEVTAGIAPFWVTHEHYRLATDPEVSVLAWRATEQGREPLLHVREHGAGRVGYLQLGHDLRIWGEPAVRHLVRRAARWACRPDAREN